MLDPGTRLGAYEIVAHLGHPRFESLVRMQAVSTGTGTGTEPRSTGS